MPSKDTGARPLPPQLYWLPSIADWTDRLRSLTTSDTSLSSEILSLAKGRLEAFETMALNRKLTRLFPEGLEALSTAKPVRLAILSSSTVDHLVPAIRIGALRHEISTDIYTPHYGQYASELRDEDSELYRFRPNYVLFALDGPHLLRGVSVSGSSSSDREALDMLTAEIVQNWRMARSAFNCRIIQQCVLPVSPALMGNNEHRLQGSQAWLLNALNYELRRLADEEGVDLLAIDLKASQDGLSAWYDPALWYRAKQEIHPLAAPVYGDLVGRLLAARQGKSCKCLVLDLDNTLWGGVIGDDGMQGISLGQGSARGEAHSDFQQYVHRLSKRGVILAVCSKNDEINAREPFDKHPDMVLRSSDIACFLANWTDKPANLRIIAERLNIGLDSLVFADDNPFERDIVRRELPMVRVPELPEDPALYSRCIADAGYFEAVSLTTEDLERGSQYQANTARESLRSSSTDVLGYLNSLNMELLWDRFDPVGLKRVVQLANKTNQFNLTTQRITDAEAADIMADEKALSLQLRLMDTYGDNGIIAVVMGKASPGTTDIVIENWLMSCRVLGRQVEQATLNLIAAEALRLGARRLIGLYKPTAKNEMVREHYPKLGFSKIRDGDTGEARWMLDLSTFSPLDVVMKVNKAGGAL